MFYNQNKKSYICNPFRVIKKYNINIEFNKFIKK